MLGYTLPYVSRLINLALSLDPFIQETLEPFSGKRIRIQVLGLPDFCCDILFENRAVTLVSATHSEYPADAEIRAPLPTLLALATQSQINVHDYPNLSLHGDIPLIESLQTVMHQLEIDWEALFAKAVGDVAAHETSQVLEQMKQQQHRFQQKLQNDTVEYLQHEAQILPSRLEVQDFIRDVDQTRLQVDRLQARLARLHQHLEFTDHE